MSGKIKVLVVDDSSFMRNVVSRLIEKDARFEVVGKAKDGKEGVEMAASLKPDVITMDIEMPVMTGIEALEEIMKTDPRPVVMVSSLTEAGATATLESLDKGAIDFIPKALQDKEKNIFQAGDALHEKLVAASKAVVSKPRVSLGSAPASSAARPALAAASATVGAVTIDETQMKNRRKEKFPMSKLLLIGTSTGGPRALQSVVPNLPADLKMPIVIAQHMPPNFTTAMASRLNASAAVEVIEGSDGDVLKAGTVYLAPGGMITRVVRDGAGFKLSVTEDQGDESVYHPSVDLLTESIANSVGGQVLAVMLTGMGSDGAKEFTNLRSKGAYVISQDEATSVVFGMPKSVIAAGSADEILPLEDVAPAIKRLLS